MAETAGAGGSGNYINALADPYGGLTEEQMEELRRLARKRTALQAGLGMLSEGYSPFPQTKFSMIAPHLATAAANHPFNEQLESLRMRRQGAGGQMGQSDMAQLLSGQQQPGAPSGPMTGTVSEADLMQLLAGAQQQEEDPWAAYMQSLLPWFLQDQTQNGMGVGLDWPVMPGTFPGQR